MNVRRLSSLCRLLFLLAVPIAATLALPATAWAHIEASDGTIDAELHVAPYDHPIVGQQATLEFTIDDTAGKFSFPACYCVLQVDHDHKQLSAVPLDDVSLAYTFQQPGDYHLTLNGRSVDDSFTAFSLPYDVHVGTALPKAPAAASPAGPYVLWALTASCGLILLVSIVLYGAPKPRKKGVVPDDGRRKA